MTRLISGVSAVSRSSSSDGAVDSRKIVFGFHTRRMPARTTMPSSGGTMSTSSGPATYSRSAWEAETTIPRTNATQPISLIPRMPSTMATSTSGMQMVMIWITGIIMCERSPSGTSPTLAPTMTGIPMAPYAPTAMLATSESTAPRSGSNPRW